MNTITEREPSPAQGGTGSDGLSRAQKAAAVLLAVGPEAAGEVLRHLAEHEVEQVALEIATLGDLPREQFEAILHEFQADVNAQLVSGGEHRAREILRSLHGAEADEIVDRLLATVETAPFHFLRLHESAKVIQHLREEHPQTVALVLSHLPTRYAAQLLAGFEPQLQAEIARRIALLEQAAPDVVTAVEVALRDRLGGVEHRATAHRGGVKELAGLLNHADRSTERAILGDLESRDPELAEEVRALMFVFEDIVTLDDRAIQEVLRNVDLKQLALALKGVSGILLETISRNLSERATETLQEEIELLGAVRVRDVEAAQTEIVRHIRRLEEDGAIIVSRGSEGEFVE